MTPPAVPATDTPTTDLRLRRTRKALREGLLTLLRTKSLEEITARDIASASLVGYNTFFRHYASKAELVEDVVEAEISNLLQKALPAVSNADTRAACLALCQYVFEHRTLWRALLIGGAAGTLRQTFVRYAIANNVRTADHLWLPMDLGAIFGVGATVDILTWWLTKPDAFTPEQVAEFINRLVVTPTVGAAAPPPQKRPVVTAKGKTSRTRR